MVRLELPEAPLLALCLGNSIRDKARLMAPCVPTYRHGRSALRAPEPISTLQPNLTGSQRPQGQLCSCEFLVNRDLKEGTEILLGPQQTEIMCKEYKHDKQGSPPRSLLVHGYRRILEQSPWSNRPKRRRNQPVLIPQARAACPNSLSCKPSGDTFCPQSLDALPAPLNHCPRMSRHLVPIWVETL